MALIYPGQWKFEGIGIEISQHTSNEFYELVEKIADGKKNIVEGFKMAFGGNGESSGYSWALTDMNGLFQGKR